MRVFGVQLRKELLEQWRTRKTVIVLAVLVLFGLMSPVLAKITPDLIKSLGEDQVDGATIILPEPTVNDAIAQYVKNVTQFGLLLAVLVSFNTIVGERTGGQAALMFPHPLPREVFVLAKFAALVILFAVGVALSAAGALVYTVILFEAPDVGGFLALNGLLLLWLTGLMALSLLASVLGHSVSTAGGLAFLFLVLFLLAGAFTTLAPDRLPGWGQTLATGVDAPARWGALIVTLAVTVSAVGASILILKRQEVG